MVCFLLYKKMEDASMSGNNAILAMYDVRGIQSYIFKTNKVREIMGASFIVRDIIMDGIKEWISDKDKSKYLWDWQNSDTCRFLDDESIQMEVLFIGGGNAYVLFRNKDLCRKANQFLARYVLDHTYSLNLAVAYIEKTDSYMDDYKVIQDKMREIKATMPSTKPMGTFPFMAWDSVTGQAITNKQSYRDGTSEWLCKESYLKAKKAYEEEFEKTEFDEMVTEKGDSSFLALVHIDGNNMGMRIRKLVQDKKSYEQAVPTMRKLSSNISNGFKECYDVMEKKAEQWAKKEPFNKGEKILLRKIVLAGDDITFVCNAKIALSLVQTFLKETVHHYLDENKKNAFSACAGMAYFNSHYPFSDAYEVAEACCSSAKAQAKLPIHQEDKMVGCYLDYQICTHISSIHLSDYRKKHYVDVNGENILARPYYVAVDHFEKLNEVNQEKSIDRFFDALHFFTNQENIARSKAKNLRNAYAFGKDEVEQYKHFLRSRKIQLPYENEKCWYDALEMMDLILLEKEDEYGKEE